MKNHLNSKILNNLPMKLHSMNVIITCILFLVISAPNTSTAQTKLKFSQVISVGTNVRTVPVGKVWKVENFLTFPNEEKAADCKEDGAVASMESAIVVNGKTIYLNNQSHSSYHTHTLEDGNPKDIFNLQAGTTIRTYCGGTKLTIVEFTIVK
jgi:hypothetical protein